MKTIYKFSKKNCPPCEAFQPVWDKIKDKYEGDDVKFTEISVDTDVGMEMAVDRGVSSVPTFMSSDGFRASGMITEKDFLTKFLKNESSDWFNVKK